MYLAIIFIKYRVIVIRVIFVGNIYYSFLNVYFSDSSINIFLFLDLEQELHKTLTAMQNRIVDLIDKIGMEEVTSM